MPSPTVTPPQLDIDTLRGLACILLVMFHVAGDSPTAGLQLPDEHWLQRVNDALAYLRMPLFALVSGFVYALRPVDTAALRFLQAKARRLLLPLATVGVLFTVLQTAAGRSDDAGWSVPLIDPPGHFWFLQALFVVFMVVAALERLGALRGGARAALTFLASVAVFLADVLPQAFALDGAAFLLPYFLAGLASHRFELLRRPWRGHALAGLLVSGTLVVLGSAPGTAHDDLAALGFSLCASFLLLALGRRWRPLAWVGAHSYAIYLFHVFFTASTRMGLQKVGVDDLAPLLALGLAAGVVGPVLAARALRAWPMLRMALLGERPPARRTPVPARVST